MALFALSLLPAAQPARAAELELPVPRLTIYPGDVIGDDQIMERAFIAHTVARSTIHEAREALLGKVARRTLLPGQPIPINGVRDPYVVVQGKNALVVFEEGGLTITTNAMALQNGGIGDLVTLRNVDSGTVIKGTVASDGTVRLAGP
jgi:flagella basal body P-ring formation protein FlgA